MLVKRSHLMFWMWFLPRGLTPEEREHHLSGHEPRSALSAALHHAAHGRYVQALEQVGTPLITENQDEAALLRVALLGQMRRYTEARTLALQHLPYFALDRWWRAMTYLLLAEISLEAGQPARALELCRVAESETTFTRGRELRIWARLLWARLCTVDHDTEQARARLQGAKRLLRTNRDRLLWHEAAAEIHFAEGNVVEGLDDLLEAMRLTPLPVHKADLERQIAGLEEGLAVDSSQPRRALEAVRHVHLSLLEDISISLDGERQSIPRDARTVLLLSYLTTHDGAGIDTVADLLLLPPRGRKERTEKRDAARVRALVARARQLLGDPTCVRADSGALYLSGRYVWTSDLNLALPDLSFPNHALPPHLQCRWLDDLLSDQT